MVQPGIGQAGAALGHKDKWAVRCSCAVLQIVIQHAACLIDQVNIPRLDAFAPQMQPPCFGTDVGVSEPQLNAVVERTFRKLATNHDLLPLYQKWFMARLPTGERLGVPISPQLEEAFKTLDDSPQGTN